MTKRQERKLVRAKAVKKAYNIQRNNKPFLKLTKKLRLQRIARRLQVKEVANEPVPKIG